MKFDIKSRFTGEVIFSIETESFKLAVETAVKSGVDLSKANLYGVDLSGADLSGADFSCADLYGANLSGADLSGANLSGKVNLYGTNLSGATLYRATLYGEKLTKEPIQILGLRWFVLITVEQIRIGCELYEAAEWEKFEDSRIALMDSDALEFWKKYKDMILGLHKIHAENK